MANSPTWLGAGAPVSLFNNYSWSPAAGLSGTSGVSVTASPAGTTTYTVTATNSVTGCSASASTTVVVSGAGTSTTWHGGSSTDWNTAGNWGCGVPTASTNAIIPAGLPRYPILTAGTATARDLTLNGGLTVNGGTLSLTGQLLNNGSLQTEGAGTVALTGGAAQVIGGSQLSRFANLTVGSAGASLGGPVQVQGQLFLDGNLSTNGQPLTLLSSANGTAVLVNNGSAAVAGNLTVQRYIDPSTNGGTGYRHYSAPVLNPPVSGLATIGFTPVVNAQYNTASNPGATNPFPTVFGYDESRLSSSPAVGGTDFDKGWFSPAAASSPLAPGRGYTVNIGGTRTVGFTGPANNSPAGSPLVLPLTRGPQAEAGWALIGNPYPAPLNWSTVGAGQLSNVGSAIYVFRSSGPYAGTYRTYQAGIGDPQIPTAQGFFVRTDNPGAGSVSLSNTNRVTAFSASATAFQRTAVDARPLVQLSVSGQNVADETTVYFQAGATAAPDAAFDAYKLVNPGASAMLASVAAGTQLSINGLPLLTSTEVRVPLHVAVPTAGTYRLVANQLLNFAAADQVLLLDQQTNLRHDLRQPAGVSVQLSAGSAGTRFVLVFRGATVTATRSNALAVALLVYPNPAHDAFTLNLPARAGSGAVQATLLNTLGQPLRTRQLAATAAGLRAEFDVRGLAAGVYLLRVETADGQTTTRKVTVE